MTSKTKTIVLSEAQMGFVDGAVKAITGWLSTETKTVEDIKTLKAEAKKAIEAHKVELNLNMKALKMSGFKFTGTAKTNPVIRALNGAFVDAGQAESTAVNSVTAVKMYYSGDVGADHKFPNGFEVTQFLPNRVRKQSKFVGLLDGKTVEVDRDAVSCAGSLIKAMEQGSFELVTRYFIKGFGVDERKVTADEITGTMRVALETAKLAVVKDGKLVAK